MPRAIFEFQITACQRELKFRYRREQVIFHDLDQLRDSDYVHDVLVRFVFLLGHLPGLLCLVVVVRTQSRLKG
jgi:hypothetical protein